MIASLGRFSVVFTFALSPAFPNTMNIRRSALLSAFTLFAALCASARQAAELQLADPFGDEMVLQRDMQVPVWGEADPGARVTVAFAGQTQTVSADAKGRWKAVLAPLKASAENRKLTVTCGDKKLEVKDVLVGEVWICSGQSNMQWGVAGAANGAAEITAANHPLLRLRYSNLVLSPVPLARINGSPWKVCTPKNLGQGTHANSFSATAYYFGRDLQADLKVPVGVVQSAWGGTLIEPWTTPDGFRSQPALKAQSAWLDKANADYQASLKQCLETLPAWEKAARSALEDGAPLPVPPPVPVHPIGNNAQPTALYNAMIAPWIGFPVRGAIWYQGESNHIQHDGPLYADRMAALVGGWRKAWGRTEADFPFYAVQIAPFRYGGCQPQELGNFWEAQQAAAQKIPNSGLAHTQDIGNPGNIHPMNKQEVGRRLARLALSRTYGAKTQGGTPIRDDCGPEFQSLEAKGGALTVKFDHAKSGLASRDGKPLTHFEIAGDDDVFAPAEAKISGNTVTLQSAKVPAPTQVRFAWSDTAEPNLMNGDKLPAASFAAPKFANLALRAPYTCSNPNTHNYGASGQLTDGSWIADGAHCFASNEDDKFPKDVVVDLQEAKELRQLKFGVPPFGSTKTVVASVSADGKTFTEVGSHVFSQEKAETVVLPFKSTKARYIKLTFTDRHDKQVGYPIGFMFMTELEAK